MLTVLPLGVLGCMGSMSPTPAGSDDYPLGSALLQGRSQLAGSVPLKVVLEHLVRAKVLAGAPWWLRADFGKPVEVAPVDSYWDILKKIEYTYGLVYNAESRTLVQPVATHSVDAPDAAGRLTNRETPLGWATRDMVWLRFRFVRGSAGVSFDGSNLTIDAAGDYIDTANQVPAGVHKAWGNITSERGYTVGEVTTQTGSSQLIPTTRQSVQAGIQYDGIAAPLPGGKFRCESTLSVSTFDGTGLDRSVVSIPIDCDGERSKWHEVFRMYNLSANLTAAFRRLGLKLGASGETVRIFVRVD